MDNFNTIDIIVCERLKLNIYFKEKTLNDTFSFNILNVIPSIAELEIRFLILLHNLLFLVRLCYKNDQK